MARKATTRKKATAPARAGKKSKKQSGALKSLRKLVAQSRQAHGKMVQRAAQAQKQVDTLAVRLRDAEASLASAMSWALSSDGAKRSTSARTGTPRKAAGTRPAGTRKTGARKTTARKTATRRPATRGASGTGAPRRGVGRGKTATTARRGGARKTAGATGASATRRSPA